MKSTKTTISVHTNFPEVVIRHQYLHFIFTLKRVAISHAPPLFSFYIHIQMSIVKVSHEPHLHLLLNFSTQIKYKVKMMKNLIQLLTNYPSHAPPGLVPR